jgi:hypothetical protein
MKAAVAIVLLSLASTAMAADPLVRVPFVGCPSGGQMGLQSAPKSGKDRWLKGKIAAQLAYYSPGDIGVLAPRGWHCSAVYGSSGAGMIVAPDKRTAEAFRRLDRVPVRGPFVWAGDSFGGTSGRGSVMEAIARYFPTHRDFIQKVRELDLLFQRLPSGPYSHDVVRQRTRESVRFTTPAWDTGEGAGAGSLIAPGARPVEGIRKLVGPREEPDLWGVDVRLPAGQIDVTEAILSEALRR